MQDGEDGSRVVAQGCVGGEGFAHEVEGAHDGRRRGVALAHGAVVDPLAFLAARDEPCIAEDLQVMRGRRLGECQILEQHAGALLSAPQELEDVQPVRIGQCFEDFDGFTGSHLLNISLS